MATAQASCNATEPGGASWEVMRILIYGMYIGYKTYISKKLIIIYIHIYDIYIYIVVFTYNIWCFHVSIYIYICMDVFKKIIL